MVSQLRKPTLRHFSLFLFLVPNSSGHPDFVDTERSDVLDNRSSSVVAHGLLLALSVLLITLLYLTASCVLRTHRHLGTVDSVLAVEHIGAVHVDFGCIHVLDHVLLYLSVVVKHRQGVCQVLGLILFFLVVPANLLLNLVYLSLDVVKTPLLTFLHLNHHFLDLLKLLETVGLHLFELLLLRHQHVQACLVWLPEECVLHHFAALSVWVIGLKTCLSVLNPVRVEPTLWLSLNGLLLVCDVVGGLFLRVLHLSEGDVICHLLSLLSFLDARLQGLGKDGRLPYGTGLKLLVVVVPFEPRLRLLRLDAETHVVELRH